MTDSRKKLLTFGAVALAMAFAVSKCLTAFQLWFHSQAFWTTLWRPYPDWGTGADLFGSLLPARWNGTREMFDGGAVFAVSLFALLFRKERLVGYYLLAAALVALLDVFWLLNGSWIWGWSSSGTTSTVVESLLWALGTVTAGIYLLRYGGREAGETPPVSVAASFARHGLFDYVCYLVAIGYAGMKITFAYQWTLNTLNWWPVGMRPYPDWGTGADLFGAMLPARWIGTRNFVYALIILFGVWKSFRERSYELLGFLMFQGMLIEFFDGFWLAEGKFNLGWGNEGIYFFVFGGLLWGPTLMTVGIYILSRRFLGNPDPFAVNPGARLAAFLVGPASGDVQRPASGAVVATRIALPSTAARYPSSPRGGSPAHRR